jgi:DNA-binding NarL/FixJ family response regulator
MVSAKEECHQSLQGVWLFAFWESNMAIRILIEDDDSTIRTLLRRLLEGHSDWRVCSEAGNGVEAIEKVEMFAPDLAILDLGMPMMNGVQAAREISKANPQLPLLLISVQEVSRQLAEAARGAGFRGAVTKSRGHEIVEAVEALVNNELFFDPEQPTSTA